MLAVFLRTKIVARVPISDFNCLQCYCHLYENKFFSTTLINEFYISVIIGTTIITHIVVNDSIIFSLLPSLLLLAYKIFKLITFVFLSQ